MLEERELEELKSRLKQEFSDYYEIAGGKNYRYRHLITTRKISLKLAKNVEKELDLKVLEVAALFHDIGRAEDIENGQMDPFEGHEGHAERGAEKVSEYVSDFVSEDELTKIESIIGNHHSEAENIEGKILQDADKISNIGVSNLWRQIHYASHHRIEMMESIEYFWNTAVEEYKDNISEMHFEKSKEVGRKRLERQKKAIRRIKEEINGEDIE